MRDTLLADLGTGETYLESMGDVVIEPAGDAARDPAAHRFELFVVHAAADASFVHGYLLPALNLALSRGASSMS
jgi:hypothetical protein